MAAMLLVAAAAKAQDDEAASTAVQRLNSTWRVAVGTNLIDFDTVAAWSPKGLAGAVIILEDALGLDQQSSTGALEVGYRINRRHSLSLSVTDLERTASRTIDEEISWGDYIFRANGTVSSELDTRIFRLMWAYDFSESDRLQAGVLAGLSTFDLGLKLEGEARLEDGEGEEWVEGVVEGADAVAPVPVLGFYLGYALTSRGILRLEADLIDLSIGSHSGRVLEASFSYEHSFSKLVGIGVGIGGTDLEYQSDEDDERFGIRYRFSYAGAYLNFTF
jgi:hypothetical protein